MQPSKHNSKHAKRKLLFALFLPLLLTASLAQYVVVKDAKLELESAYVPELYVHGDTSISFEILNKGTAEAEVISTELIGLGEGYEPSQTNPKTLKPGYTGIFWYNFDKEILCNIIRLESKKFEFELDYTGTAGIPKTLESRRIYVVDTGNNRIQKFSPDGAFITEWGEQGSGEGQFESPQEITTDSQGNIYVKDTGNNRIQKFDSNDNHITEMNLDNVEFESKKFAIDSDGNIYTFIANGDDTKIEKTDFDENPISGWGEQYSFQDPQAITIDSEGNVYVTDTGNNRILKLSPDGVLLSEWGAQGPREGQFESPQAIAILENTLTILNPLNITITRPRKKTLALYLNDYAHMSFEIENYASGPVKYQITPITNEGIFITYSSEQGNYDSQNIQEQTFTISPGSKENPAKQRWEASILYAMGGEKENIKVGVFDPEGCTDPIEDSREPVVLTRLTKQVVALPDIKASSIATLITAATLILFLRLKKKP